jgi:hypothetical protein
LFLFIGKEATKIISSLVSVLGHVLAIKSFPGKLKVQSHPTKTVCDVPGHWGRVGHTWVKLGPTNMGENANSLLFRQMIVSLRT